MFRSTSHSRFTVRTRTPLHATKLPLRVWLAGLWLMLQSDKGISSIRLAEALGVSQPTAWRMGHALRLMVGREQALDGVVEIDRQPLVPVRPEPTAPRSYHGWDHGPGLLHVERACARPHSDGLEKTPDEMVEAWRPGVDKEVASS